MTECLCPQCSILVGETYAEAWRLTTEARHVLSLPFDARRAYLDSLPPERGEPLKRAVREEWRKRQEAA